MRASPTKIAVTSSLNLDITVNPDFSQVEVDRQITNLSRFSLFFPEKRQFFIENSDLFSQFGFRQIRPFFSRRIGLSNGNVIPIIGGALNILLVMPGFVMTYSILYKDYREKEESEFLPSF